MQLIRTYYNSTDLLRIDYLGLELHVSYAPIVRYTGEGPKFSARRTLQTKLDHTTSDTRTVDKIEIVGDFDTIETSSGNYTWAKFVDGDTTYVLDMSDLPGIGAAV